MKYAYYIYAYHHLFMNANLSIDPDSFKNLPLGLGHEFKPQFYHLHGGDTFFVISWNVYLIWVIILITENQ